MQAEEDHTLSARIVSFARFLRANDIPSDPTMLIDAHHIARVGFMQKRSLLKAGYRSCFCRNRDHWQRFDTLFEQFWAPYDIHVDMMPMDDQASAQTTTVSSGEQRLLGLAGTSEKQAEEESLFGAGDFKALSLADFRFVFNPAQMHEIERMVDELAKKTRRNFIRRETISNKGSRIHLGRSLHRSVRYQGQVAEFVYRRRRRRLPRFVLLLDISQSMDTYAKLFLRFTRKLMTLFDQSTAFAFNTELIKLGSGFHQMTEAHFVQTLNSKAKGWLGGTKIALSLDDFNSHHLSRCVNHKTTVLIFSDGCDTAKPEQLATQVATIQRRAGKLIWVNPLLGRFEANEVDRYMDPVVPFVDAYRSAHNVESLRVLTRDMLRL